MGKKTEKILKDAKKHTPRTRGDQTSAQGLVIVAGVLMAGVIIGSAARKKRCGCRHC